MFSSGLAFGLCKALIGFGLHRLHPLKKGKKTSPSPRAGELAPVADGEPLPAVANQDAPAVGKAARAHLQLPAGKGRFRPSAPIAT